MALLLEPGIVTSSEYYQEGVTTKGVSLMDNLKVITGDGDEPTYPNRDIAGDAGYAQLRSSLNETGVDGVVHNITSKCVFWAAPGTKSALTKGVTSIDGLVNAIITDEALGSSMAVYLDKLLTKWVNGILLTVSDLDNCAIDSFKSDLGDLVEYLNSRSLGSIIERLEAGIKGFIKVAEIKEDPYGIALLLPEANLAITGGITLAGDEPYVITVDTAPNIFSVIKTAIEEGRLCYVLTDSCKRLACMSNDRATLVLVSM